MCRRSRGGLLAHHLGVIYYTTAEECTHHTRCATKRASAGQPRQRALAQAGQTGSATPCAQIRPGNSDPQIGSSIKLYMAFSVLRRHYPVRRTAQRFASNEERILTGGPAWSGGGVVV